MSQVEQLRRFMPISVPYKWNVSPELEANKLILMRFTSKRWRSSCKREDIKLIFRASWFQLTSKITLVSSPFNYRPSIKQQRLFPLSRRTPGCVKSSIPTFERVKVNCQFLPFKCNVSCIPAAYLFIRAHCQTFWSHIQNHYPYEHRT